MNVAEDVSKQFKMHLNTFSQGKVPIAIFNFEVCYRHWLRRIVFAYLILVIRNTRTVNLILEIGLAQ